MYLVGIAVFLFGLIAVHFFVGLTFAVYINPATIFMLLFSLAGVTVATSGFGLFIRGLNAVVSKKYYIADEDREQALALFRLLSKTSIFSMLIMAMIRFITSMAHLDSVEVLTHSLATIPLSLALGFTVSLVFFETAAYVLQHRAAAAPAPAYPRKLAERLLELCRQNGIAEEDILSATGIELKQD